MTINVFFFLRYIQLHYYRWKLWKKKTDEHAFWSKVLCIDALDNTGNAISRISRVWWDKFVIVMENVTSLISDIFFFSPVYNFVLFFLLVLHLHQRIYRFIIILGRKNWTINYYYFFFALTVFRSTIFVNFSIPKIFRGNEWKLNSEH